MNNYRIPLSYLIASLFCLTLLLTENQRALAGGPIDCGGKPIRVGLFKLGYRFYVENGQGKGMNVDILEELRKRTGCKFVSQEMSFARIMSDLASGDLDVSLSGIWSAERERTLWMIPSIASKNYAVIGPAARSSVSNGEDFFNNKKLQFGVVRGYTHGKELDQWLKKMRHEGRVEESANVDILYEKLKMGRIDGMFSFPFVYRKILSELKIMDYVSIQDWSPSDKGIIGCTMLTKSRFSETEANRWRVLIDKMQHDGTLKRIFTRYVSAAEAGQMLDF